MKVKKITKPELDGDTYLIVQAVNHNAELLESALNRIKELEKVKPCKEEQEPILEKVRAEIKEWYWQADKQALAKDPCVVDAMIDLFIRTIDKYKAGSRSEE